MGRGRGTSTRPRCARRPHPSPLPGGRGDRHVRHWHGPLAADCAKDPECAESLKKRTLTNLYNQRPTWLAQVHQKLDEAVFAAYGWDPDISDEELLAKLLELNLERAGVEGCIAK